LDFETGFAGDFAAGFAARAPLPELDAASCFRGAAGCASGTACSSPPKFRTSQRAATFDFGGVTSAFARFQSASIAWHPSH
jgi:hypothetical protein